MLKPSEAEETVPMLKPSEEKIRAQSKDQSICLLVLMFRLLKMMFNKKYSLPYFVAYFLLYMLI